MEQQQKNAKKIAEWLRTQPKIKSVYYVGLPDHPGYEVNANQTSGAGSMISFQVDSEETARTLLEKMCIRDRNRLMIRQSMQFP